MRRAEHYFEIMSIDEERLHVLTKYASTKGSQCKVESDHNILVGKFSIQYNLIKTKVVKEVFILKTRIVNKSFMK